MNSCDNDVLLAGAAQREITPDRPTQLFGYPHQVRVSTGIHDPLLCSAFVLKRGGATVVQAVLDLLFVDPPRARRTRSAIAESLVIPEDFVFISCTHTHSGPVSSGFLALRNDPVYGDPDPAYMEWVTEQAVLACRDADAAARPAELAWTAADARGVGGNRLAENGVTDSECGILAVRDIESRKPISISLIYGMHPTVLHEDSTLLSADFVYFTRRQLRDSYGEDLVVLHQNAPCGNQSPRYFVRSQTFAEAERLGRMLAGAVGPAIGAIGSSAWTRKPVLRAGRTEADIAGYVRNFPPLPEAEALLTESQATLDRLIADRAPRPVIRTAECAVFGAESAVGLSQAQETGEIKRLLERYAPFEVQALRIGEICIAGLPGEQFCEYALRIKQSASIRTFVVSLVNGHLEGYIVTEEAAARGGYEAANSLFSPPAGDVMVSAVLDLINSLSRSHEPAVPLDPGMNSGVRIK